MARANWYQAFMYLARAHFRPGKLITPAHFAEIVGRYRNEFKPKPKKKKKR